MTCSCSAYWFTQVTNLKINKMEAFLPFDFSFLAHFIPIKLKLQTVPPGWCSRAQTQTCRRLCYQLKIHFLKLLSTAASLKHSIMWQCCRLGWKQRVPEALWMKQVGLKPRQADCRWRGLSVSRVIYMTWLLQRAFVSLGEEETETGTGTGTGFSGLTVLNICELMTLT